MPFWLCCCYLWTDVIFRLSKLASSKLRDNNPNITDLSDPNRPTKLAEQMAELYDNEWTDTFEEIQESEGISDEKVIQKLLETLMVRLVFYKY